MTQFQSMALDYLEHYESEEFERLKKDRQLKARMDELLAQLYDETERVKQRLSSEHPERSDEQLQLEAEQIAIANVLPMDQ